MAGTHKTFVAQADAFNGAWRTASELHEDQTQPECIDSEQQGKEEMSLLVQYTTAVTSSSDPKSVHVRRMSR